MDQNHAEIVHALRDVGCSVLSLASLGRGAPDLLCGYKGRNVLLEVKKPKGKLNDQHRASNVAQRLHDLGVVRWMRRCWCWGLCHEPHRILRAARYR